MHDFINKQTLDYIESTGRFRVLYFEKDGDIITQCKVEFFTVRQCINRGLHPEHQIVSDKS